MHWGQHWAFAHCGQYVITSVQLAAEWVPGTQEARPWLFFLLEPTIRYQVTYYLVNLYDSYWWKPKHLQVLSLWSLPPTLLPPSNQCQPTVKTYQPQIKKPSCTWSDSADLFPPFSSHLHIFLRQMHRQVNFLVMSLISHVNLYKTLILSLSYSFHGRKMKEKVFASQRCYGNQIRYFYVKVL